MLNEKKERELVYIVTVDDVHPIPGKDRVECAVVGGWTCMVPKGAFEPGSAGIYFEIDSKLPEEERFAFTSRYGYKIKTQRFKTSEGPFYSQGLLMSPEDFGWTVQVEPLGGVRTEVVLDDEGKAHYPDNESRFLTQKLGVTYAVVEDNKRKANSIDKYKKMAQRRPHLFSQKWARWMMKRDWGKKIMFFFFGKKKDKKNGWPAWVQKTDEERVQNMPWILNNKEPWIATEKIDGTSTTFTMKRRYFGKYDFFVCSRNVCFDKPDKNCFYETNVYTEMAEKYDIENKMKDMMKTVFRGCKWITIQGETYGEGVQKRDYSLKGHDFMAFNLISSDGGRWNTLNMKRFLETTYDIPCVPVVDEFFILPDTVEELLEYATNKSVVDGKEREGIVFRSQDGAQSFKAVSNEFLLKYHGG